MKLLICSKYVPKGVDGQSFSVRQSFKFFEKKGIDVAICTSSIGWTKEDIKKEVSSKIKIYGSLADSGLSPGIFFYLLRNLGKFDAIQLDGLYNFPTIIGANLARFFRIPYFICPRGARIPTLQNHSMIKSPWKKLLFFNFFSKNALLNATRIICASEKEKEHILQQINTNNIVVIKNGIDVTQYSNPITHSILEERLGIKPNQSFFLFLGRIALEKGLVFLLDVWQEVIKKNPNALLVIAGKDHYGYEKVITKKISKLSNPKSVIKTGVVTGELKLALLQWSECLLFPSYAESFGNVVIEALASGTPVIASHGTPWEELEKESLGYWLPWNTADWAEAILEMNENKKWKNKNFCKKSQAWVSKNFNVTDTVKQYTDLYEECLSR